MNTSKITNSQLGIKTGRPATFGEKFAFSMIAAIVTYLFIHQ